MRQMMLIAVITGAIAVTVAGCSSDSDTNTSNPSPSPVASQKIPAKAQPFGSKPLVAQQPPNLNAAAGLIQATNPDERIKQILASINPQKNQTDPFKNLPLGTPVTPGVSRKDVPKVPQLPSNPKPSSTSTPLTPPKPSSPFPPSSTAGRPSVGTGPSVAALPPVPTATLANGVEVKGVVKVGSVLQAIIKAPNEKSSRYVSVGQRLSNGRVLVKRIDESAGSEPIVVLEENGIEVSKAVGEPPKQPKDSTPQNPDSNA